MNAYKVVLVVSLLLAIIVALTVPLFTVADETVVLSVIVLAEAVADVAATAYILWLVIRDRRKPRSWLLLMLFTTSAIVTIGYIGIGALVAWRFLGNPPLSGGAGLLISAMAIVLIGAVPVMKATLFALVQHDPSARNGDAADERP